MVKHQIKCSLTSNQLHSIAPLSDYPSTVVRVTAAVQTVTSHKHDIRHSSIVRRVATQFIIIIIFLLRVRKHGTPSLAGDQPQQD
jgi:hypothetical protein